MKRKVFGFLAVVSILALAVCFTPGCKKASDTGNGSQAIGSTGRPGANASAREGEYAGKIKIGHVVGVCQGCMFIGHDQGFFKEEGLDTEPVWTPHPSDAQTMLNAGELQIVHGPFTAFYRAVDQGADVKIVAGSGCQGLCIIAQPATGIKTVEDLVASKGKGLKVGTQRMNTLELCWWSLLSDHGLTYRDFDMKFFNDHFTMMAAFENKDLDIITHVEPYATMLSDKYHGVRIADSVQVWGKGSPDCVVSVQSDFLKKYPGTVKKYLRALLRADEFIKQDMKRAATLLDTGHHYKVDGDTIAAALPRQPPSVDLRPGLKYMTKGVEDMVKLGYLKKVPENVIDLSILERVVAEHDKAAKGSEASAEEAKSVGKGPLEPANKEAK